MDLAKHLRQYSDNHIEALYEDAIAYPHTRSLGRTMGQLAVVYRTKTAGQLVDAISVEAAARFRRQRDEARTDTDRTRIVEWIDQRYDANQEAKADDRGDDGDYEASDAYHDGYEQALADLRKLIEEG